MCRGGPFKMADTARRSSPRAPPREADGLDNVHAHLADINEEEDEKPKRAVTPAEQQQEKHSEEWV